MKLGIIEREVAKLLIQGLDNKEIGKEIGMAPRTVKEYISRLLHKFNVRGGLPRVKLAVILYRRREELCLVQQGMGAEQLKALLQEKRKQSGWPRVAIQVKNWAKDSELQGAVQKSHSIESTTRLDYGIELN